MIFVDPGLKAEVIEPFQWWLPILPVHIRALQSFTHFKTLAEWTVLAVIMQTQSLYLFYLSFIVDVVTVIYSVYLLVYILVNIGYLKCATEITLTGLDLQDT